MALKDCNYDQTQNKFPEFKEISEIIRDLIF